MANPYRKTAKLRNKQADAMEEGVINPSSFGGTSESGKVEAGDSKMFDSEGTVNAYDKKDALQQIAHLLQNVVKDTPAPITALKKESSISKEAKREAILAAFKDPTGEGFAMIGNELLAPIKEIVDYESWARKLLRVRPLAQGELFRITKDVAYQTISWVVGQDGQTPESRVYGKYTIPPEFKITAFPSIDIADIYQMQYDGLDRAQDLARQDIERKEDQALVSALDNAATTFNDVTNFSSLGITAFEDMRYQVEQHRLVVDKFLINRQELSDIVTTMSGLVDPVTERELILAGYIGNILNAQIITSAGTGVFEVVPAGTVYAVPAPEYLGDMGIRVDLFSEPFNQYANQLTVKGWAFMEILGIGLPNSRSISKGLKA
jgi:hypothetical protein